MNKVILIGRIGKDAELRTFDSGHRHAVATLATNDGTKDKPQTNWHNLTFWNTQADNAAKYLKKGTLIAVEGRLVYRDYEKDGVQRKHIEVVVDRWEFAGSSSKKDQDSAPTEASAPGQAKFNAPSDDDLPF